MTLTPEQLDAIGRVMHESWSATKRAQGFHGPTEPCTYDDLYCQSFRCIKFHADLIPWEQLPDEQKDINRHAADGLIERGVLVPTSQLAEVTKAGEYWASQYNQTEKERLRLLEQFERMSCGHVRADLQSQPEWTEAEHGAPVLEDESGIGYWCCSCQRAEREKAASLAAFEDQVREYLDCATRPYTGITKIRRA